MNDAIAALVGAAIGALASIGVVLIGALFDARRQRREKLQETCAELTGALILMGSLSYGLRSTGGAQRDALLERIYRVHEDAEVSCERLRLLSGSERAQEAGRYALRHAWAIWRERETGSDPRGHQYPAHRSPRVRFREALHELYVEIRRETGIKNPEDVFPEPDD
jgi:hypothetical protein